MGRPDGGSVFEAHLHAHDVSGEYPNPPWPQLNVLLQRGTMAEIACLARTVRAAQDLAGERDLAYLIDAALTTRAEAGDEVAALVARQPNACFRSLLLASAMLEGRAVENVLAAQRGLIRILDVATEIEHEFEKFDLAHRFRGVEAEVDGDATVRFPRLGYAEAVRRHFWSNYPGLRENLQRWVVECDSRIAGPGDVGDEFVRRFTDACFSARRPDDVVAAINSWALGSTAQVTLAASALAYGLEDARTRWWFHRQCERWASTRTLRPQIAELVIAACVGNIAPNHPGEAVGVAPALPEPRQSCGGSRWIRTVFPGRRSSGPSPIAGSTDHLPPRSYRPPRNRPRSFPGRGATDRTRGRRRRHRNANRRSRRSR